MTFSKLGGAIHSEHIEHRVQMQTLSHPRQLLYDETNELMLMVDSSLQPTLTKSQQDTHTQGEKTLLMSLFLHRLPAVTAFVVIYPLQLFAPPPKD